MGKTTLASFVGYTIGFAISRGLSAETLFERLGIDASDLTDPDAELPAEVHLETWRALLEHEPEEGLGLIHARNLEMSLMGPMGYAAQHAPNLRESLKTVIRFLALVDPDMQIHSLELNHLWRIEISHRPEVMALVEPIDTMIGGIFVCGKKMAGEKFVPVEVQLPHSRIHAPSHYEDFFGCPVTYDAPVTAMILNSELADLPIKEASDGTHRYLFKYLAQRASEAPKQSLVLKVRAAIDAVIESTEISQDGIARSLGMSTRSLQRKLGEEGTTFRDVLDEERRHRALFLLRDASLALYEIAFLLGFKEPRAFQRAFKRWTGESPRDFRKSLV